MVPVGLILYFGGSFLHLIYNKDDEKYIYENGGRFCKIIIPGIFLNAIYQCTKCYLNAQNIYNIQVYTTAITTAGHVLWAWLFISKLKLDVTGAALARNCTELLNLSVLWGFVLLK